MKTYKKLVRFLKDSFPQDYPVSVRRVKMSKAYDGDCELKKKYFLVRINNRLPEHVAIDTLLHEYAHCVAWNKCMVDHHCSEWGKAYSKIYRAFLKEFLDG